jgi:hypothetical protein
VDAGQIAPAAAAPGEVAVNDLTVHWRSQFDNAYLGAWNLYSAKTGKFATVTVTVERIQQAQTVLQGGRKQLSWLMHFRGKRTPMILSKTMGKVMQEMFGRTMQDWIGKEITLWVETDVRVKGGVGDVLRIKNTAAGKGLKRQLAPTPPEDDEPDAPAPEPEKFGDDDAAT